MPQNSSYVGTVVVGNGTYSTRLMPSENEAKRLQSVWYTRSAGSYTAPLANVWSDGTTSGAGAAAAKTYLQSLSLTQLRRTRVDVRTAAKLKA